MTSATARLGAFVMLGLFGTGCAGKARSTRGEPATRVPNSIPERNAATAAQATRGGSEQDEERFGFEADRARDADRKAKKRGQVDVVGAGKGATRAAPVGPAEVRTPAPDGADVTKTAPPRATGEPK